MWYRLLNLCKEPNDQILEVMITKREFLDSISGHVSYIDCKQGGRPGPGPEPALSQEQQKLIETKVAEIEQTITTINKYAENNKK